MADAMVNRAITFPVLTGILSRRFRCALFETQWQHHPVGQSILQNHRLRKIHNNSTAIPNRLSNTIDLSAIAEASIMFGLSQT